MVKNIAARCHSGFDFHGLACLRPETWIVLARAHTPYHEALRISQLSNMRWLRRW